MSVVPEHRPISARLARKGRRLHRDGKIWHVPDGHVYIAEGDHGIYPLVVIGEYIFCLCPHHGACSHQQGVRIARRPDEKPARALTVEDVGVALAAFNADHAPALNHENGATP